MGNPTTYTEALAEEIIAWVSEGKPLRAYCRQDDKPGKSTIADWRKAHPEFDEAYKAARDEGFDALAEDCLSIADDAGDDFRLGEKSVLADTDHIQRSKLRVWTRLQLLAKWDPRRYGDKLDLTHGGKVETNLTVTFVDSPGNGSRD